MSNLIPLMIYATGAYLLYRFGLVRAVCYLAVVVLLEFRLIREALPRMLLLLEDLRLRERPALRAVL